MIEDLTIGSIAESSESILVPKGGTHKKTAGWKTQASLQSKTVISPTLSRYDIELQDYEIKPYGQTTAWLGRHFILRLDNDHSTGRNYTTANALTPQSIQVRDIIDAFIQKGCEGQLVLPPELKANRQSLSLFIKRYESKGGLSQRLADSSVQVNKQTVKGPTE